jgi:alkylhydroperoxidase family enzyme
LQGESFKTAAEALRNGDLDAAGLPRPEWLLLKFVETITRAAYQVTDEQVQGLRDAGWEDEQIAEAAYDAALFNLFVRLADTFGIEPPTLYEPDGIPGAAIPAGSARPGASRRPPRVAGR